MEILTASWVVPVASAPLRDGRVAVEGGRIAWVGRAGNPGEPKAPVRDLGPGILLPGLVNAHCHLELSHLAGRVPFGGGFVELDPAIIVRMATQGGAEALDLPELEAKDVDDPCRHLLSGEARLRRLEA